MSYETWLLLFQGLGRAGVIGGPVAGLLHVLVQLMSSPRKFSKNEPGWKSQRFKLLTQGIGITLAIAIPLFGTAVWLAQTHPEFDQRLDQELATNAVTQHQRSDNPAIQACFDRYQYNPNDADPDRWRETHDASAGRMEVATRYDGSAILKDGQQVYNIAIPKIGDTVEFNEAGYSEGAAGCQMYRDPDTGAWEDANGM